MTGEHIVDDFRRLRTKIIFKILIPIFSCPIFIFRASTFLGMTGNYTGTFEKIRVAASDRFFILVVFSGSEHDMHMDVMRTVAHRSDFVMDSIRVVVIFQFSSDECFHDFFLGFKRQLIWECKYDLLISFSICTLIEIGSGEKFLRIAFGPCRKKISFADTSSSLLECSLAINILNVAETIRS